jgi:WD40 repeat protein
MLLGAAAGCWVLQPGKPPSKRETRSKFVIADLPASVTVVPPAPKKPNPKLGVSQACWSADSCYLATVNENMPQAVWVWAVQEGELAAVLLLVSGVKSLAWAPVGGGSLAVATGGGRLYLWSVNGASVVHVPLQGFQVHKLAWSPHGNSCVVMDREAYCCVYTAPAADS